MHASPVPNPPVTSGKAAAHRAMAIAALHGDSSLSVRLRRYNLHMEKALGIEVSGQLVLGSPITHTEISKLNQSRIAQQKA